MNILDQLRRDEGVRYAAYRDSLGNWTTGVGHLIRSDEAWLMTTVLSASGGSAIACAYYDNSSPIGAGTNFLIGGTYNCA